MNGVRSDVQVFGTPLASRYMKRKTEAGIRIGVPIDVPAGNKRKDLYI
jgi:hypothetical protein